MLLSRSKLLCALRANLLANLVRLSIPTLLWAPFAWGQSASASGSATPPAPSTPSAGTAKPAPEGNEKPEGAAKPPDGKGPQQGAPKKSPKQAVRNEMGLSVEASLARATAFYEAGQYSQCADSFGGLLDDPAQASSIAPRAREQASVYRAACLIALSRTDEADETFRQAIRENPQMAVPNAIVFPPAVIERFIIVRTTLMEEIRRADEERAHRERQAALAAQQKAEQEKLRVQRLDKLASQETLVVQNQRWIAWVPFGVGQFQNRDYVLGGAFLATEVLLVGTAITATSIELSLNAQAKGGAGLSGDLTQLNQNIRTANAIALYTTGGFLLVAAVGILQANLAFVPEFPGGVRTRAKPKRVPPPEPTVGFAPMPGGAAFSVFGRFSALVLATGVTSALDLFLWVARLRRAPRDWESFRGSRDFVRARRDLTAGCGRSTRLRAAVRVRRCERRRGSPRSRRPRRWSPPAPRRAAPSAGPPRAGRAATWAARAAAPARVRTRARARARRPGEL